MTFAGWLQLAVLVAVITALTPLLGGYMARVYMGERFALARVLGPIERFFYKLFGVDTRPGSRRGRNRHARS
ncbi:MAG: potassium-transporting ATPase subunit KdpA [Solirubrobacteraceae bacterium]